MRVMKLGSHNDASPTRANINQACKANTQKRHEIAVGGLSLIYRVQADQDIWLEKLLLPKFQGKPDYEKLLDNEFEVLDRLDHPAIPKAFGLQASVGITGQSTRVLITEFIDGWSLDEVLGFVSALEVKERRYWGLQFYSQFREVLGYLQSHAVVHGDLALENVMISKGGQIKLIDFATAHIQTDKNQAGNSLGFRVQGRESFRAPELRSSGEISLEGDLFAAGRILEELWGDSATPDDKKIIETLCVDRRLPVVVEPQKIERLPKPDKVANPFRIIRNQTKLMSPALPPVLWCLSYGGRLAGALIAVLALSSWCPMARLEINSLPFSHVRLGVSGGWQETPVRNLVVEAGHQTLEFRVPAQDREIFLRTLQLEHAEQLKVFEDFRNADTLRQ